jgi:integrative and conjugative element protein (TIGR02256 family)
VIAPWFVRQPALLRSECDALARDFPELTRDEGAFAQGKLAFVGTVLVGLGARNEEVRLSLEYPDGFPYSRPDVIPLTTDPSGTGRVPRFFSARHQMANGSICLFEREPTDDPRAYVTGVAALRRARTWLPHAIRGSLPTELDNRESDFEAHYQRVGDVLLGPLMYGDLARAGELVVVDYRPGFRDERYPLFIVTHVESGNVWRSEETALRRIGPERPATFWLGAPPADGRRIRWYALDKEPPPVRTSSALAALLFPEDAEPLARLKRSFRRELVVDNAVDVPVRMPARRSGAYEWLFFRFPIRAASQPRRKVSGIAQAGVELDFSRSDALDSALPHVLRVHDLRPRSLQVRNLRRVPADAHEFHIGLAGAGSLGSTCADLLAKAGVGGLRIVDPDLCNVHNAVRHSGGIGAVGFPKPFVVAVSVSDHNPHCDVSFENLASVLNLEESDRFWGATAILSTIADDTVELALNRTATARGVTVYYLRALRSGSAGRLLRVRPGLDACLECIAHYHADGDRRALAIPPQDNEVIARECGQPVLAASAADLAIVGGLGVRQLLHELAGSGANNQWVWTSEGIQEVESLRHAYSSATASLPPHDRCGICAVGVPGRVRVPKSLRAFIVEQARRHAPNETGGILVGRRMGDVIEISLVSDAGPNAVSQLARFERDGPHCQAFLEAAARETPGVDYVGEWHSHPGSSARPSGRDTASFREIADDTDYLTTAPVLIIVAPSATDERVEWSHTIFPVAALARAIELEEAGGSLQ